MIWTSGTTGAPKPILHTHTGVPRAARPRARPAAAGGGEQPAKPPTPNLIPVSLALNAGIYNVLFGLRAGAALVIMDRFEPQAFAELVRRFEIRSTVLPPAAMTMLADADVDRPRRRCGTCAASPRRCRRSRPGASPASSASSCSTGTARPRSARSSAGPRPTPRSTPRRSAPSAGRTPASIEIAAMRTDDGRSAAARAAADDAATPASTRPHRRRRLLDTGDLARIDDDGFVWIEGRAGDLINRGGNKVFPDGRGGAAPRARRADAAVVGVPDDRLGEVPVAFLVGDPVATDVLVALCREHLVAYKVPVAFLGSTSCRAARSARCCGATSWRPTRPAEGRPGAPTPASLSRRGRRGSRARRRRRSTCCCRGHGRS